MSWRKGEEEKGGGRRGGGRRRGGRTTQPPEDTSPEAPPRPAGGGQGGPQSPASEMVATSHLPTAEGALWWVLQGQVAVAAVKGSSWQHLPGSGGAGGVFLVSALEVAEEEPERKNLPWAGVAGFHGDEG